MEEGGAVVSGPFGRFALVTSANGLAPHAHPEWNVICQLTGASDVYRFRSEALRLAAGRMVAIPPWTAHSKDRLDEGTSQSISFLIKAAWLNEKLPRNAGDWAWPKGLWTASCKGAVGQVLDLLLKSAASGSRRGATRRNEDVLAFILAIASPGLRRSVILRDEELPKLLDHRIRAALDHIRRMNGGVRDLGVVARQVGLSRSHFFKRFSESVGASPAHVCDAFKLAFAIDRLANSDVSIAEVAEELGFSTQGHFARFFKQHVMLPPAAYRFRLKNSAADF
jgi:AraC family transcriptional regulator